MNYSNEMGRMMDHSYQDSSLQLSVNKLNIGFICIGIGLVCVGVGLGYVGFGIGKLTKLPKQATERKMEKEDWHKIWKMIENTTNDDKKNFDDIL